MLKSDGHTEGIMKKQKASLEAELADIEHKLFELETRFLEEAVELCLYSNALGGRGRMRGLRSVVRLAKALKKPSVQHRHRLFSLSSATSSAHFLLLAQSESKVCPYFNDVSFAAFIKSRRPDLCESKALACLNRRQRKLPDSKCI